MVWPMPWKLHLWHLPWICPRNWWGGRPTRVGNFENGQMMMNHSLKIFFLLGVSYVRQCLMGDIYVYILHIPLYFGKEANMVCIIRSEVEVYCWVVLVPLAFWLDDTVIVKSWALHGWHGIIALQSRHIMAQFRSSADLPRFRQRKRWLRSLCFELCLHPVSFDSNHTTKVSILSWAFPADH